MTKSLISVTFKLVLVAVAASLLAFSVGISNYVLVGILAILSVSVTKKDSLINGLKRYINVVYALLLSTLLFVLFGFNYYVYVLFLAVFIFTSFLTNIEIGLIPSIVLANHVFDFGRFNASFLQEEVFIITIAVAVAVLINLFYPVNWSNQMREQMILVDDMLKEHLKILSVVVSKNAKEEINEECVLSNKLILDKIQFAETLDKDKVFANDHRYLAYAYMRRNQLNLINNIYESSLRIKSFHPYQELIATYIKELILDIGDDNRAIVQLEKLNNLNESFKREPLPKTRDEFETRAILFHMLEDLRSMLKVKEVFHQRYPKFEI